MKSPERSLHHRIPVQILFQSDCCFRSHRVPVHVCIWVSYWHWRIPAQFWWHCKNILEAIVWTKYMLTTPIRTPSISNKYHFISFFYLGYRLLKKTNTFTVIAHVSNVVWTSCWPKSVGGIDYFYSNAYNKWRFTASHEKN